ncbi:hypothetical protein CAC42_3522 [Sphaceloma murrayae]|uniref:NAD(P)-binding domain-containing protein n=1 Tax=Sphaceloma murrayae TaxID=2082308 RepID=A0A2K1R1L7_9PEZI|nr:hypothetical protein CAC42_3522 [Sphaceloma murrayae]
MSITQVAIFGASGNFGRPTTQALLAASFNVTIFTRPDSTTPHPPSIPQIRTPYTVDELTPLLAPFDAVILLLGPAALPSISAITTAAHAAAVSRLIINDFGWGPHPRTLPSFSTIHAARKQNWDLAASLAADTTSSSSSSPSFSWTGISTGNPIDWALARFPLMGFDVVNRSALLYDSATQEFTGTTLEGIANAVVGVLRRPDETKNRFVSVLSLRTSQGAVFRAFEEKVPGWTVRRDQAKRLREEGEGKCERGEKGWVLDLAVAQLFEEGEGRCCVAEDWEVSDSELVGVRKETVGEVVDKVLKEVGAKSSE